MAARDSRLQAAELAIGSIGLGYDINQDIDFKICKTGSPLIIINQEERRNLQISGVTVPDVPKSIKCFRGESLRIQSDVLTLQQMSEQFNIDMCLDRNISSGYFCKSFGLSGHQAKDHAITKSLAYDGWFIKKFIIALDEYDAAQLHDHVKEAVPSSWDPKAFTRFIKEFGTHVVVAVSMGGKNVVYMRQEHQSSLHPTNLQKLLNDIADMRFADTENNIAPYRVKEEIIAVTYSRKGGSNDINLNHREWLDTVDLEPDVISMHFLPLTSLVKSIPVNGFISHALTLYLHDKPPIEDLCQYFEFQLRKQWAPVNELRHSFRLRHQDNTWLQFGVFGRKLYINTAPVDVGNRPVTGLRFKLQGRESNCLTIHLQHLPSLPKSFPLTDSSNIYLACESNNCNFHKKVKWNCRSYVCTAPVETEDPACIVTGCQLQVENKCLFLRLRFSKVNGATLQKVPEWDGSIRFDQFHSKPKGILACFPNHMEMRNHPKPGERTIGSTSYSIDRPEPVKTPEFRSFVDTTEMIRGGEDTPGYWVVSGARLAVHNGKIHLFVKYSLLSIVE
ncbi:hypothetical protein L6164_036841 [Bauhinia variegata]|uniref:Uncharacterized protein n=1 Tax=Bauhinia variegata TaxID=167791 RepID=A0ACB9KI92_BAUVA|nr:hypothetical protein L6164_036841 [Bauhinia variegata]